MLLVARPICKEDSRMFETSQSKRTALPTLRGETVFHAQTPQFTVELNETEILRKLRGPPQGRTRRASEVCNNGNLLNCTLSNAIKLLCQEKKWLNNSSKC